jgi:N4-gp56 family major capsid protein
MAIQGFSLTPQRVGIIKGRILKHAMPKIVLGTVGVNDDFKANSGDTVKYRRFLSKGATAAQPNRFFQDDANGGSQGTNDRTNAYAAAHLTAEGITSAAESIGTQDISATLQQYNVLYGYTDRTFDLYEDDIPKAMTELVGERVGLVHETALFGVLKGCTNKFYGGTGTSRATVNGTLSLLNLRKIARVLHANHAETVTNMVAKNTGSGLYGSSAIGSHCYPVFISTDLIPDVQDLPGWIPVEKYGKETVAVAGEIGSVDSTFRFICSPELVAVQDGGAAVAGSVPALLSTSGTYADVYQVIVGSADAWGHVGVNVGGKDITALTPGQKDKADPQGQRGYVGAKFYYNAVILNNLQMAVLEVATNALSA